MQSRLMNVAAFIFSFRLAPAAFAAGLIVAAISGAPGGIWPAPPAPRMAAADSLRGA
ncbi:MAG TPA: hypothetical protein VNF29_05585 [Candidatus Binataceae bacterium]|nr:hypothetical protein [Candidatus Binataceae bacterium]